MGGNLKHPLVISDLQVAVRRAAMVAQASDTTSSSFGRSGIFTQKRS
jgi:hypothetical protein